MAIEISYIEEEGMYNISGLKYSVEEAESIAHFIEATEFDKYVKKNPTYLDQMFQWMQFQYET